MPTLCEWGLEGVRMLGGRCAVLVIVDVLSFSTCLDVALSRGAGVIPFGSSDPEDAAQEARRRGARFAKKRSVANDGPSLSPPSLGTLSPGTLLLLPSPNGSRLSVAAASSGAHVFAACLRNAAAVAGAARLAAGSGAIGVVPAGERWPDGSLRVALEDQIGAGAVVAALGAAASPEANAARHVFEGARSSLDETLRACQSGVELIERGWPQDVECAAQFNVSSCAPRLRDGVFLKNQAS
jgi:2-phosphosulfolactate phosphatase